VLNEADDKHQLDKELIHLWWQEAHDLIKRLEGSSVLRLTVQLGECKIEIERGVPTAAGTLAGAPGALPSASETAEAARAAEPDTRHPILSPLVGTFYRSPQPGAKAFVEEGDLVEKGQPVAIVEAMKIMNQIQADRSGRVAQIMVTDAEWVEFQQVLMYLEPTET
jgi:acetyl-CoA carboxylase biotin carboxyl carrier protein